MSFRERTSPTCPLSAGDWDSFRRPPSAPNSARRIAPQGPSPKSVEFGVHTVTRPVIALMGDGSMHYGITSLWTAARYKIPLTIVVSSNEENGVPKQFRDIEGATGVPGLDLPRLNIEATAASYGIDAHEASDTDQIAEMLRAGVDDRERPTLINVRTDKVKKAPPA